MRGITRIRANNPGPFTERGTNSYVITRGSGAVVIDPGPDDARHSDAIIEAAGFRPVTHILLTHAHRDHSDGIGRMKSLTGATVVGFGRSGLTAPALRPDQSPSGGDYADWEFKPDERVRDGEIIQAAGIDIEAVHTPGHAPDHLCFALSGSDVLFSGDHVMGWSTSVIAPPEGNMGDYLGALEKLIPRAESRYLPGHGEEIDDALRTVRAYLIHRQMREQAVLEAIRRGGATVQSVMEAVYAGIAPQLRNAARLSVAAHSEHLAQKGLVSFTGTLSPVTALTAV